MAEYFDMMGNINSMNQGFNALGDLGRFMLQKRGMDMQQKQQDYLNRQADRKRMLDEAKAEQIRQIMLGAQTRRQTVATPYTVTEEVDVTEPAGVVDGGDIAAYMQQPVAIYNREKADKQVPSMADQGDFSGLAGQAPEWIPPDIAAYMQGMPGASPMAKAVEAPKKVDPLELLRQMPISPVEAVRRIGTQKIERTEMREHTEDVPNENWLGDAARGVAAIDPELGMEMAKDASALSPKSGGELDDVRSLLNSARGKQSQLIAQGVQKDDPQMVALDGEIAGYLEELRTSENPSVRTALNRTAQPVAVETVDAGAISTATTEANALIDAAKDANNDGIVDDFSKLDRELGSIALKYGINQNDKDWQNVKTYLQSKKDEVKQNYSARVEKSERAKAEARAAKGDERAKAGDELSQDEKYKAMWSANQRLKAAPNDVTAKRSTMNLALRKETGAVIGADEFDAMMSTVLNTADYNRFKSEAQSLKTDLLGMANDNLRESYLKRIGERYLGNVDSGKLYTYLDDKIPDGYYKRAKTEKKAGPAGAPVVPAQTPAAPKLKYKWNN